MAPARRLSLSVLVKSGYCDSNAHPKNRTQIAFAGRAAVDGAAVLSASLSADRPWTGQGMRQGKIVAHAASEPARTPQLLPTRDRARAAWLREVSPISP